MEDTMKTILSLAVLALLGLLASCTINPHPMDMTQAVQQAKTRSDQEALAKHYEDAAKEMQATRMSIEKCSLNTRQTRLYTASRLKV